MTKYKPVIDKLIDEAMQKSEVGDFAKPAIGKLAKSLDISRQTAGRWMTGEPFEAPDMRIVTRFKNFFSRILGREVQVIEEIEIDE